MGIIILVESSDCMEDLYCYECQLYKKGINLIAGIDEVGRGPLIGPVVSACVILPKEFKLEGLTDSKKLSEKKRNKFNEIILKEAIAVGIGQVEADEIDKLNIYEATKVAMKKALDNLKIKPEHFLIDAMPLDIDITSTSIIKGDSKSITIAAASVVAKVYRDEILKKLDKIYPMYGLYNNKGYPTKKHLDAIKEYGICKHHRLSFGPVLKSKDKRID